VDFIEQVDSEAEKSVFAVSDGEAMDVDDAETELSEYNVPVLRLATENSFTRTTHPRVDCPYLRIL
jgi:hypothetical protein